jgi:hypothetical protein
LACESGKDMAYDPSSKHYFGSTTLIWTYGNRVYIAYSMNLSTYNIKPADLKEISEPLYQSAILYGLIPIHTNEYVQLSIVIVILIMYFTTEVKNYNQNKNNKAKGKT